MQDQKTLKNNLINPLKDKRRTMKLNHVLSNKYVLIAIIAVTNIFMLLALSYLTNIILNIPHLFKGKEGLNYYLGLRNILPQLQYITLSKVLLFLIIIGIFDLILIYKIKVSYSEDYFNVGQKGVARFVTSEEIIQEYKEVDELETPYKGMPGIVVSRIGKKLYLDDSVVNNLIIGITRSGKGELFIKSSIETYSRAEFLPSLLINDPKVELYKFFKEKLESRGYDVYLLNCSNPEISMGYNPLTIVITYHKKKDYDTAEMIANSFAYSYFNVEDASGDMKYFVSAASDLCVAMILASVADAFAEDERVNQNYYQSWNLQDAEQKKEHPFETICENEKTINFYSMIINFGKLVTKPVNKTGTKTMLDVYFEARPADDRARLKYLSVQIAPGKTKSGVFSEMLRNLSVFSLNKVAKMTAESSLDFMDLGFGKKPIAVFMATPSYDKSLSKIPSIFIRQMYYVLGKACDDYKGRCDRQVKCVIDEAGNMSLIELLDIMISMGLGQYISFDLYLQNYEQLTKIYGKEMAENIKGNNGNHFYLLSQSEETREEFSKKLGNKSFIDVQRSGSKLGLDKYFMESVQEQPLLNPNELGEFQEGEVAICRISKRRDNKGNKIKARPIHNSIENGRELKYAYEYFGLEYKHPNTVNLMDICTESRAHINPKKRVWNIQKSFTLLESNDRIERIGDCENYDALNEVLTKLLGLNYQTLYGLSQETTMAEFAEFLDKEKKITAIEKQAIEGLMQSEQSEEEIWEQKQL